MNNTPKNSDFSCNFYCTAHVWVPPRVKYALYGNALMWKCIFSSLWVLCSITDCSQIATLIPTPKRSELVTAVYNSSSNITDRIVQCLCHKRSILRGLSGYPCGLWTFWDLTYFSLTLGFAGFCSFNSKKHHFILDQCPPHSDCHSSCPQQHFCFSQTHKPWTWVYGV